MPAAPEPVQNGGQGAGEAAKTAGLKNFDPLVKDVSGAPALRPTLAVNVDDGEEEIVLKTSSDEPGAILTVVVALACILILLGTYVLFANYSKLWIPEMDASGVPQPPTGLFIK
jgi:hypothetical protein